MTTYRIQDGLIEAICDGCQVGSLSFADHGEAISALEMETQPGHSGVAPYLGAELVKLAGDRPIWCSVDFANLKALEFFIAAGFSIEYILVKKNNG